MPNGKVLEISPYWHYKFMRNGVPVFINTKQKNKETAGDMESAHRTRLAKGEAGLQAGKVPTLKQFEDRFTKAIRIRCAEKPATVSFYESKLKNLLAFAQLANSRLDRIEEALIEKYVQHRRASVGPASTNRELATLRRALRLAQEWKVINRVPRIRMLPGERTREFVLSREQEPKYLKACPSPLRQIAIVMLDTGLRPGEALALEWPDIRLEERDDRNYLQVRSGKSKNAKRAIPLTPRAIELLREMSSLAVDRFVFSSVGRPYSGPHIDHLHQEVRDNLGWDEDFVPHGLRHTFGTRLGEAGADAFTIMKLMGHSTVTVSQRYVHPSTDALERAIGKLSAGASLGTQGSSKKRKKTRKSITIKALARVAKSADAKDLKSFFRQRECGFKSHPGHHVFWLAKERER
jgi:integrase